MIIGNLCMRRKGHYKTGEEEILSVKVRKQKLTYLLDSNFTDSGLGVGTSLTKNLRVTLDINSTTLQH